MNKILLIISLIGMLNCNSKTQNNYSDELKTCLTNQDITQLNIAIKIFEDKLAKNYPDQSINKSYLSFLDDLNLMKFSPDFFLNPSAKKAIADLKTSGTFDKIWTSLSSIESETDEGEMVVIELSENNDTEKPKLDLITLNPKGEYLKCILLKTPNKHVSKLLNMQKDVPGLGFQIPSRILAKNMTEKDFNNGLNRTVVSIGFYYELAYAIQNNQN